MKEYKHKKMSLIITGASRGLGKEIALYFSKQEKQLFLLSRNYSKIKQVKKTILKYNKNVHIKKCNISKLYQIDSAVKSAEKKLKDIDVLINNAKIYQKNDFQKTEEKDFNKILDTNLKGTFFLTKRVLKNMLKNKKGKIITILSIGALKGLAHKSIYSASEFAIRGFIQAISKEFKNYDLEFYNIYLYYVDTHRKILKNKKNSDFINKVEDVICEIDKIINTKKYKKRYNEIIIKPRIILTESEFNKKILKRSE